MTTRSQISLALISTLCAFTASAIAEPYWITYEGNDLPENEGWQRVTYNGEAYRWIEDGALVIDSLHDVHIEDLAKMERWMDPGPSELFVAEWRLLVEASSTGYDAGVAIARSFSPGFVFFGFGPDEAWNALDNLFFDIEPGIYHTYRFESEDMVDFEFSIDGQLVQEGTFHWPSSNQSYMNFGDKFDGWASLSRWDYVHFGVMPEPSALWLFVAGLAACVLRAVPSRMRRVVLLPVLACVLSASANAEPYWITYEGNDFPENEGWAYIWSTPRAIRWIEDGSLVIDSRASGATNDWYEWYPEWVNPEAEELFIAEWRLRVDELTIGWRDPTIGAYGDDYWGVGFNLNEDTITSVFEDDVSAYFEPYLFHDFELRSADMRTYQLYIDGSLAIQGAFWESLISSRVLWGDGVSGGASLTHWDYFRFGVVPEATSIITMLVLLVAWQNVQRTETRT